MVNSEIPSPVLTVDETAVILRLSRQSAYEGVRTGAIPSVKIGRRILVPRARLMAMLEGAEQAVEA